MESRTGDQAYCNDKDAFHNIFTIAESLKWASEAYWTVEEATALSFGKDPRVVNLGYVERAARPSEFAALFVSLHEQILDAQRRKELPTHLMPRVFIEWTKLSNVDFPNHLEEAVKTFESGVEKIRERNRVLEGELRATKKQIQQLQYQLDRSRASAASITNPVPRAPNPTAEAKIKQSLLKMVLVMAIKGYEYRIGERRQSAAVDVMKDAELLGMTLDDRTIREHLKASVDEFGHLVPEEYKSTKGAEP